MGRAAVLLIAAILGAGCEEARRRVNPPFESPTPPPSTAAEYIGNYTMTVDIGERCVVPENVRSRTYTATIASAVGDPAKSTKLVVTLKDATFRQGCGNNFFAPGLGCNQFTASAEGEGIRFGLAGLDEGEGGQIWELLPGAEFILAAGNAFGRFEGPDIVASGSTEVWYGAPPAQLCFGTDYRLTFTRR